MKKVVKKLSLNKKTIAGLSLADMSGVQGGIVETGCVVTACCKVTRLNTQCKCEITIIM